MVVLLLTEHRKNVKFVQGDVNKLVLEANSQDLVFSCWLLMYLSDEEVCEWALKVLWVGLGSVVGGARWWCGWG